MTERANRANSGAPRSAKFPRVFLVLLLMSLPLVNPWVRGDGVGYYAFARALLIQRNLDFADDYRHANEGFREARLDSTGNPKKEFRTGTGHLDNHFAVGPAILWSPFLICAHAGVLLARGLGSHVAADGFSLPYILAMALGTLFYGFLSLVLSYRVACRFIEARWALWSTIAIWWASSLPVYMYFNPSWSHAHSAFAVALFFWYWLETGPARSMTQWLVLALLAGLMLNAYYPNAFVLTVLIPEAVVLYRGPVAPGSGVCGAGNVLLRHVVFCAITLFAMLPTFLTKYCLYGSPFESGYIPMRFWNWRSPNFLPLLISADHGLFSWTPVLLFATVGLVLFCRKFPEIGLPVACVVTAFYIFMAAYPDWTGISSFGNRFFVSLTIFFVLGLAALLEQIGSWFRRKAAAAAFLGTTLALVVLWNLGLIFQWGAHLIPARGPVVWREVAYNQFHVVPRQLTSQFRSYLFRRQATLREIERRDIQLLFPSKP